MTDREKLIDFVLKLTNEEAEKILSHLSEMSKPKPRSTYHRFIYSIKNNVTGREYIGRTADLKKRIQHHMACLRSGNHCVEDMQADFDKYGDNFTISILEEITDFKQNKREYELIESHKSYIRDNGYNYNDTTFRKWKAAKEKTNGETKELHR